MVRLAGIYQPSSNATHSPPTEMAFTSKALTAFIQHIKARPDPHILDMGPVCSENINFLAQKVHQLFICDMFIRLDQKHQKGQAPGGVWQHIDYAPDTFDGILMWGLPGRLDADVVGQLGKKCHRLLKAGGLVMVCALGENKKNTRVDAFVLAGDSSISFRGQPHLDLPLYTRNTRELVDSLAPLKLVQSFLFRNGLREFLFRKE